MNPTLDVIAGRRSLRAYVDERLSEDEKDAILTVAFRAPTAGNMMLYPIMEVEDQAIKYRLAVSYDNQPFIAAAPFALLFLADYQRWMDVYAHSDRTLKPGNFETDPEAWRGITWGLLEGFVRWQLQADYAVGSVNVRLATVKGYARLAMKAGSLSQVKFAMILTVKGYAHKEALHIDEQRKVHDVSTRKALKRRQQYL